MIDNMTAVSHLQKWVLSNLQNVTNCLEIYGNGQSLEKSGFQQHTFQVQKTVLQIMILGNSIIALSGCFQILFSKS